MKRTPTTPSPRWPEPQPKSGLRAAIEEARTETPNQKTIRLLKEAVEAVNALSVHLEKVGKRPPMFKANRALHSLWEINP